MTLRELAIQPRGHIQKDNYIMFRYLRFKLKYNLTTNELHIVHPVHGETPGVYIPPEERGVLREARPTHPALLRTIKQLELARLWKGSDHGCIPVKQIFSDMANYKPYGPEVTFCDNGPEVRSVDFDYR